MRHMKKIFDLSFVFVLFYLFLTSFLLHRHEEIDMTSGSYIQLKDNPYISRFQSKSTCIICSITLCETENKFQQPYFT